MVTVMGRGQSADVVAMPPNSVMKIFRDGTADAAERELQALLLAHELGLPVPKPDRVLRHGDGFGLLMEAVAGATVLRQFANRPVGMLSALARMAQVQATLNRHPAPALRAQRPRLERAIARAGLPAPDRERILELLNALALAAPDDRLCHGDFHPGNVLIGKAGLVVVDWELAVRGAPAADAARTLLLLLLGRPGGGRLTQHAGTAGRKLAAWFYLRSYAAAAAIEPGEVRRWLPVVAAARLATDPANRVRLRELVDRAA